MQYFHRFRSWSTSIAVAAVIVAAAAPPVTATTRDDDTARRLEAAHALLVRSAASLSDAQLASLSETLSDALESSHFGLETSALRLLIAYGNQVSFGRAMAIDVVKLYRNHPDDNVRRMAVVALGQMHDSWSMDFLKRSLRFENSEPVKYTIASVVARYQADRDA